MHTDFASALEHSAENRTHSEAALHVVSRHSRGIQPRIEALRVVHGRALAVFHPHRLFAKYAACRGIDLDSRLVDRLVDYLARVSRAVYKRAGRHHDGIDMHFKAQNGIPVYYDARNDSVVHNDVFDADSVENHRSGLAGAENQPRRHLDGIDRMVLVVVRNRRYAHFAQYFGRVVLHRNLVEQHSAAPCSAAGRELRLVDCDLEPRLGQIVRGDEPARPRPDYRDIDRQIVFELLEITAHDRAGYHFFHHSCFAVHNLPSFYLFLRGHYPVQVLGVFSACTHHAHKHPINWAALYHIAA